MATQYADRAFLSVNGAKIADLQTANLNRNFNSKAVPNMTEDNFNTGFVQGNTDIDLDFEIAIQNALSTPKIENLPFGQADIAITWICGADQYVASGIYPKTVKDSAPGIGQEAKKSWTYGALRYTDAVGNSVLFGLSLG